MLSVTITVSRTNQGSLQYQSSDNNIVSVTGSGSSTHLRLFPTTGDLSIQLTFVPGTGIDSLNSLITPASAFGSSPILGNNGELILTCTYLPLYESWAFPTNLGATPPGGAPPLFHDPTIVFNPPSGGPESQLEEAPVAAEPIMV